MSGRHRTMGARSTICLSMIVRDEAHIVRETIDSVASYIDRWVIVDTGSSDATIETVCAGMAAHGISGDLHERPWRDFGSNRTEALRLCRGQADYIWVIDADDLVVGDLDLSRLAADSYLLRYGKDFRYWRRQIFRDGLRWRYEGAVHEYPVCDDAATEERLAGDYYVDSRRLGSRSAAADKYERDCRLLRAAVDRDPDDARSVFYLAQSLFDAGNHAEALEWYTRRAEMGGWAEEVFYSRLRRAACLSLIDESWERALTAYLAAWEMRPTRAEPLYEIARHHRLADNFHLGYLFAKRASEISYPDEDSLFVASDVYDWRAADELAICAYYTGRNEESFAVCGQLLEGDLPEAERERVEANQDFSVPWLEGSRCEYPAALVESLTERTFRPPARDAEVTLTITSCRRLALFEQTVNSFLRCCSDVARISRWICVDNGSTAADRARMSELYPFIEFIHTEPDAHRHADSMNLLLEAVATPLWLHLEDDWRFHWRGPYVERGLQILDDDPTIGQVAFNRNYGETLECRRIVGGEIRRSRADGLRYRVHEYLDPASDSWRQHLGGLPPGALTAAYWPHFTLRPSLMRTKAIKSVGSFEPDSPQSAPEARQFELEFARRYAAAGCRTAFLDAINCVHTGRLTSDGPGESAASAYDLISGGRDLSRPDDSEAASLDAADLRVCVINLDRRPDRWASFQRALSHASDTPFAARCRRFPAVNGMELSMTPEIRRLFRGNDFAFRRGMIGCALSHIAVWRSVAERGEDALQLVFEDDVRPRVGLESQIAGVLGQLHRSHEDFDLVLLGYLSTHGESRPDPPAPSCVRPMRWDRHVGGCWAYLISGRGARKLLELTERDGVQNGIDTFVMLKQRDLHAFECDPPLAEATMAVPGSAVDSDIQHDFAPVSSARATPGGRGQAGQPAAEAEPAIRVRMLANWCSPEELRELFNRMTTDGEYAWRFRGFDGLQHRLVMTDDDDEDCDYWVLINAPGADEQATFDPARTVVFQMEPLMHTEGMRERWGSWAAPSPLAFLQVRDHRRYRNSGDWWVGLSYDELRYGEPPVKTRTMSSCVSAKYFDPGHRRRIDFLRFLDERDADIDIYGAHENGFRRWRSGTPVFDKRAAVLPYRYYFDAENNFAPNFYTEKIVDCLLAETLCFYWGCPNLDSFFDPRAFIRLDLEDFEADLSRVRQAIEADEWEARLPYIRAEKQRVLDEYQFFPTLARVLDPARRQRRWHIGEGDRNLVGRLIGARRGGVFVELSDRTGAPETSETLDVERRLDWSGLCLEASPERARRARAVRDCTVVDDNGAGPVDQLLTRNGLAPDAIDWLNVAVRDPDKLLGTAGRLNLSRVRANVISIGNTSAAARRRAAEQLERFGYVPMEQTGEEAVLAAFTRRGRNDVFGFYHLYAVNNWREVMGEQLARWLQSGLADATARVFASVVGTDADEAAATLRSAGGERIELVHCSEDPSPSERPLLEYAREFSAHREPLARACWYMHAKGVSDPHAKNPNVADWRRLMEHFIVERWRDCADVLDSHDACGVNWQLEPAPHFSGNFWWATPRYLANLPMSIGPAHFDPERWIGTNQPRIHSFHSSGVNHYLEPYPANSYLGAASAAGS